MHRLEMCRQVSTVSTCRERVSLTRERAGEIVSLTRGENWCSAPAREVSSGIDCIDLWGEIVSLTKESRRVS